MLQPGYASAAGYGGEGAMGLSAQCPYSQPAPWWRLLHSSFSRRLESGLHLTFGAQTVGFQSPGISSVGGTGLTF